MNDHDTENNPIRNPMVQKRSEEIDETDRDQTELAEHPNQQGPGIRPPNFIPVGEAEPIIDRDEVWVH